MWSGGENNIPEGGKKAVDVPACDPTVASCPDAMSVETDCDIPFEEGVCVDGQPVSDASVYADTIDYPDGSSNVHMTSAQSVFFGDVEPSAFSSPASSTGEAPAGLPGYDVNSDAILEDIFLDLKKPSTPASAIDALVQGPPVGIFSAPPGITASSVSESYDFLGPAVDGKEYTQAYGEGLNGLRELGIFLDLSPEEMVSTDIRGAKDGVAAYAYAEKSIYAEGISYGWTVSHALEFYKTSVYEAGRSSVNEGGTGHEVVELSGFNFGLNMTDLNKRDPSGKLGDILRDRMRQLANEEFGGKFWEGGYAGNGVRSADNIAATKNMTVLVMDGPYDSGTEVLTEQRAEAGLANVQKKLQDYVESNEFNRRMAEVHGDKASGMKLAGVRIGLAGYYGKTCVNPDVVVEGKLETRIVEFLGELHSGEDFASAMHRTSAADKNFYVRTKSTAGTYGAGTSTHKLYGLYKSTSPGKAKTWKPGTTPEGKLEVTEADIKGGDLLRPAHDFGMGKRHVDEIEERLGALEDAIEEYKSVRRNNPLKLDDALAKVSEAKQELAGYIENPPAEIDPSRLGVVERLKGDYERSRKVYRFRAANGEDMMVYKPDHMQQVVTSEVGKAKGFTVEMAVMGGDEFTVVVKDAKGKQWVAYIELGNCRDYMLSFAFQDGIRDPVFAQFLDIVKGIENKGKEGELNIGEAFKGVASDFRSAHEARPYTYTEKVPLPGGKWKGVQFGVEGRKIYFKKPTGISSAEFESKVGKIVADESFKRVVGENFVSAWSVDEAEIVSEEAFAKKGPISRMRVWHFEGNNNELYREGSCRMRDAYTPGRTLTMEVAFAPLKDVRDFPILVNEVLPKGAQKMKGTGESVVELPGLTWAQRRKSRVEERLAYSAGTFMFASMGSKLIMNALKGDDLLKDVSAVETFGTWGAMGVGAAGTEMAYKIAAAAKAGNLFVMTASGARRLNAGALRRAPVGRSAKVMGGLATAGALATVQLWEDGEVDVVSLGNSIVLIKSAQYITRGLTAAGPLRKATNFNPVKLLVEFVIMEGLGIAEEAVVESYYRTENREALADKMKEVDAAIVAMHVAKENDSVDGFMAAQVAYEEALAAVGETFGELMTFEKYTSADEYDVVHDANDEVEDLEGDLVRAENTEGHPDDMPDWQKMNYMGPTSGSAGVTSMRFSKSYMNNVRRQRRSTYASKKEAAYEAVKKAETSFNAGTLSLDGSVSASDLHIPFGFEEEAFVEEKACAYQPAGPVIPMESIEINHDPNRGRTALDMAEGDWEDRYYDTLSGDPHELMVQYMLFVKERQDYLNALITKSSDASDFD